MLGSPNQQLFDARDLALEKPSLYLFAPSRSRLLDASFPGDEKRKADVVSVPGMSAVVVPEPSPNRYSKLKLSVLGEPLQLIDVMQFDSPQDWNHLLLAAARDSADARRAMAECEAARGDGRQMFFYLFDRDTDDLLLDDRTDLSCAEKEERARVIRAVHAPLCDRLYDRYCDRDLSEPPSYADLKVVHDLFISAMRCFDTGDAVELVGRALLDFAAGRLRRTIGFSLGENACLSTVTEPHSDAIFLFAELAVAAIDRCLEPAFWMDLLPHLVKMQGYYLARFPEARCLGDYAGGIPHLERIVSNRVDDRFTKTLDRESLEGQIRVYLGQTEQSCRGRLCGPNRH